MEFFRAYQVMNQVQRTRKIFQAKQKITLLTSCYQYIEGSL